MGYRTRFQETEEFVEPRSPAGSNRKRRAKLDLGASDPRHRDRRLQPGFPGLFPLWTCSTPDTARRSGVSQKIVIRLLRAALLGHIAIECLKTADARLHRLLAEPPRKRKNQVQSPLRALSERIWGWGGGALAVQQQAPTHPQRAPPPREEQGG